MGRWTRNLHHSCPIRPGKFYRFTIQGQEGTLWWHAHSSWLRATGALIIHPKEGENYPFPGQSTNSGIYYFLRSLITETSSILKSKLSSVPFNPGLDADQVSGGIENPISVVKDKLQEQEQALMYPVLIPSTNQVTSTSVPMIKMLYIKPFISPYAGTRPDNPDVLIKADQPPARYYMARAHSAQALIIPQPSLTCNNFFVPLTVSRTIQFSILTAYSRHTATATAFTTKFRSPRKVEVPKEIDENLFF
ncbi:hypothetical protein HAX54_036928 [Datura stramonium]|uniref:Plastocyanin-like domain-containing protein n=1 Tax=Datura stramonium TaxID=4076 RepID=A0ABS8VKC4_DATST|nr:hypothetical protein [Datura stramonium]